VGSVYTVDAIERSAEAVVDSLFRLPQEKLHEERDPRARPQHKQVRAALTREHAGVLANATEEVVGWLAEQARQRTPKCEHKTVVIMDGQPSLWEAIRKLIPTEERIKIRDLLHVTPYLWKAAHLFHPQGSNAVIRFVRDSVLRVLKGKRRERLDKICRYLKKNQSRMHYDGYLAACYPIASAKPNICIPTALFLIQHHGRLLRK
jgi:hypothetical protein